MYTFLQLGFKYLKYNLIASNGKGHGIHSPFVFDFIKKVMTDKKEKDVYKGIENVRQGLLMNDKVLTIEDLGAGSTIVSANKRTIRQIAASSLKPKKFGQLLYRIVQYYKPETIIELGTSLGITTSYLSTANPAAKVYTLEGAKEVSAIAQQNFRKAGICNVQIIEGNFDQTLPAMLYDIPQVDFAFIDGNHRKQPTIHYFELLLKKANDNSIFIFDDIHWSKEMEEAWRFVQQHPSVTLTIDLFFIGIVFFRKEQRVQQHFVVKF